MTWKFLAAALVTYNLRQPGRLLPARRELTPFPSLADFFYLAFFPVLLTGFMVALRASSLRVSWGRLLLDSLILVLGFGTFFWFFVISPAAAANEEELRALRADAGLHRPRLPDADGDRRAAHERDELPAAQDDARAADGRIRADVPRRHRLGHVGRREHRTSPGRTSRMSCTSPATPSSPAPPRCRSATSRGRSASTRRAAAR